MQPSKSCLSLIRNNNWQWTWLEPPPSQWIELDIKIKLDSLKGTLLICCDFINQKEIYMQKIYTDLWHYKCSNHFLLSFVLYHHAKTHAEWLSCSWDITDLRTWKFNWLRAFSDHAQLKIYKATFTFLKSVSTCQKLCRLVNSYFRCSWFKNSVIWLAKSIFGLNQLETFKSPFILLQSFPACKK